MQLLKHRDDHSVNYMQCLMLLFEDISREAASYSCFCLDFILLIAILLAFITLSLIDMDW